MASISNAMWRRVGDQPFGLGLERFESSDKQRSIWRFRITKHASDTVIEVDASPGDLREIIRFCEQAIEYVQTDGGRHSDDEATPAAEAA